MTLLAQTSLLAALITIAITISIFLRVRRTRLQSHFAYFNINLALCLISTFFLSLGDRPGDLGLRALLLASLGLPVTGLRFFSLFLPDLEKVISRLLSLCYPATVIFGGIAVTPLYKRALPINLHAMYVIGTFIVCFFFIAMRYRDSRSAGERSRLRPLIYGGFTTLTLVTLDVVSYNFTWPYVFLGNLCLALYMYYTLQIILTMRPLDMSEVLGRGAILGVLSFLIAGIYWLLTFWVGTSKLGPFFFSVLVASIVILILYEPLKSEVEARAAEYFFQQKRELRLLLEQLRRDLLLVIDLDKMARLLIDTLKRSKRITHASLYLLRVDADFERMHSFGIGDPPTELIDVRKHASFIHYLQETLNPIIKQDIEFRYASTLFSWRTEGEGHVEEERLLDILRTFDELQADVCFPFISSGQQILGFLNIKDERFELSYTSQEISFMMMVAAQAAITIENSRLFETVKERHRLAALGEMSAGLAHEIRNPLGAIKGAAQLLNPSKLDPNNREFVDIILEEVDRLNGVVCQFLDYARPLRIGFELVDINQVLRRTLQLLEAESPPTDIEIRHDLFDELPRLYAGAEQLKQVFINLIRNGLEAMPNGGVLEIQTQLIGETDTPTVEINFSDEGEGISPEVMKNIFIPFYTTKGMGTGLGLSICQRIIEHHEGTIQIQNRPEGGARFTIRLPVQRSHIPELGSY